MQEDGKVKEVAAEVTGLSKKMSEVLSKVTDTQKGIANVVERFKEGVNTASNFEEKLISNSRSLGQNATFAKRIGDDLAKAGINVLKMGGNLDDVLTTFKTMTDSLEKTAYFSVRFLSNVQAVKEFGVGEQTIQGFVKFFDKVGGGMDMAMDKTIQMVNTAQKYGLNASKLVGDVAAKMDMLNKYGFPKGVDDLASMVVKSKQLGDSLSVAQNMADQIMDSPEKAYEMAAQLQTLGGSFSQLGDGAQLLYMAQNDLQGLQDQVIKATRGIATFNSETGQFQISANERLRLKQLKNLGMDADKVEETALKLAKQEKIIQEMNFLPKFDQLKSEEKEVLAAYAQIGKGGKITIEGQDISSLTPDKIKTIFDTLTNNGKQLSANVDENAKVINDNLSANEKVTLTLNKLNNAYAIGLMSQTNFSKGLDALAEPMNRLTKPIGDLVAGLSQEGSAQLRAARSGYSTAINTSVNAATGALATATTAITNPPPEYYFGVEGKVTIDVTGVDAKIADLIKTDVETYVSELVAKKMEEMRKKGPKYTTS